MIYVGESTTYWQNNIGFFSFCLALDVSPLFTARISLVPLLFTSLTNETPFGIHEVNSVCWKLFQSCVQIARRCKTSITLTFPWTSNLHTERHAHRNPPPPSGTRLSSRLDEKHSPFAQSHTILLRILLVLDLHYSFYKVWSKTVCKQQQTLYRRQVICRQSHFLQKSHKHTYKSQPTYIPIYAYATRKQPPVC